MQVYAPEHVTIFGNTPIELDELLLVDNGIDQEGSGSKRY